MDKRQLANYMNFAALILYFIGRIANIGILAWIGLGIMALSSIWTILHWKEFDKYSVYISIGFLLLIGLSLFRLFGLFEF